MKYWLIFITLLVIGCSSVNEAPYSLAPEPVTYVHENEYVIYAEGPWCPWYPGVKKCDPKPPGIYLVDEKGNIKEFSNSPIREHNGQALKTSASASKRAGGCMLYQDRGVACSPNFLLEASITNDPLVENLWGLTEDGIGVQKLWEDTESAPDIRVAIVDTGVECEHEDLLCEKEYDAITDKEGVGTGRDQNGHGTHCAGTACAVGGNGKGIVGVSQTCSILAGKFMGANGSGSLFSAAKAIDWAIKNDAHIINASFGAGFNAEVMEKIVAKADRLGVLIVAAAGNNGRNIDDAPLYPASYRYENVITVAAHKQEGTKASFSNYGKSSVHIVAPGQSIFSTYPSNQYRSLSGTSMAAPHITGVAALLWQNELGKGTKREQMLRVKSELLSMGSEDLTDVTQYGIFRSFQPEADPTCEVGKCRKCYRKCSRNFNCQCKRWVKCRSKCEEKSKCGMNCKEISL